MLFKGQITSAILALVSLVSADQLVGKYWDCSPATKGTVNPPEDAIKITQSWGNIELAWEALYRMYAGEFGATPIGAAPAPGCEASPEAHGANRLLRGGSTELNSRIENFRRAAYIHNDPLYVASSVNYDPTNHIDLIMHGWVDPVGNYKVCAWAIRANTWDEIVATEKLVKC